MSRFSLGTALLCAFIKLYKPFYRRNLDARYPSDSDQVYLPSLDAAAMLRTHFIENETLLSSGVLKVPSLYIDSFWPFEFISQQLCLSVILPVSVSNAGNFYF
jgi:hypothetical protein